MLKNFRGNRGQVISGEYVVASVLIIAALTVMFTYVKRALQGRVYDAQRYVMKQASNALNDGVSPDKTYSVGMEYEPYYDVSSANADVYQKDTSHLSAGMTYNKSVDFEQRVRAVSNQLQPGAAQ